MISFAIVASYTVGENHGFDCIYKEIYAGLEGSARETATTKLSGVVQSGSEVEEAAISKSQEYIWDTFISTRCMWPRHKQFILSSD